MEVGLNQGDIVLDGDPAHRPREGTQQHPHFPLARSPISASAELFFIYEKWSGHARPAATPLSMATVK